MKIAHFSTYDLRGGAARGAYRLHKELLERGINSSFAVQEKSSNDDTVFEYDAGMSLGRKISNKFISGGWKQALAWHRRSGFERANEFSPSWSRSIRKPLRDVDLVNLHWVSDFVDYNGFLREQVKLCPVIWRVCDMNPITGGCHYDYGCQRFIDGCYDCPQLEGMVGMDWARVIWSNKRRCFDQIDANKLVFVAQSKWMAEQIVRSKLTRKFRVEVISNGVDTKLFRPRCVDDVRDVLGIPKQAIVLLFVGDPVTAHRKGLDLLAKALHYVPKTLDLCLLLVGGGAVKIDFAVPHIDVGKLSNPYLLSLMYNVADIYLFPSRQDNCPNTVLEAISTGCPTIAFDSGGVSEMVDNLQTGMIVPFGDISLFGQAIDRLARDDQMRTRLSSAARRDAEVRFSVHNQVNKHISLYEEIVHSK